MTTTPASSQSGSRPRSPTSYRFQVKDMGFNLMVSQITRRRSNTVVSHIALGCLQHSLSIPAEQTHISSQPTSLMMIARDGTPDYPGSPVLGTRRRGGCSSSAAGTLHRSVNWVISHGLWATSRSRSPSISLTYNQSEDQTSLDIPPGLLSHPHEYPAVSRQTHFPPESFTGNLGVVSDYPGALVLVTGRRGGIYTQSALVYTSTLSATSSGKNLPWEVLAMVAGAEHRSNPPLV